MAETLAELLEDLIGLWVVEVERLPRNLVRIRLASHGSSVVEVFTIDSDIRRASGPTSEGKS